MLSRLKMLPKCVRLLGVVVLANIVYSIGLIVRHPTLPPEPESKPSIERYAQEGNLEEILPLYYGRSIEITLKPVHVYYNGELEIGLQAADSFIKAESYYLGKDFLRCRPENLVSPEKAKEVYEILKKGISSGKLESITLRGRFNKYQLFETYGVTIAGKDYSLLKYPK